MLPFASKNPDAIVVGSGPNGLAAAITLAQAGRSVVVYEAEELAGGGARSAELTLPGFIHDVCSSVHPMAASSPFFRSLPLGEFGLTWVFPEIDLAHPFDDGTAILLSRSLEKSCAQFGKDRERVGALIAPFVRSWDKLSAGVLRPVGIPRHPWILGRFGLKAIGSAAGLSSRQFKTEKARAVFAGMAAHSALPLTNWASSSFGLILWTLCHAVGWPFARGGSQAITNSLANYLKSLGGEVVSGVRINSLNELPGSSVILCDVTPRQFVAIAGDRISRVERGRLQNFRYGPGAFKIDWALNEPIPWKSEGCKRAGTVHLGGSFEEICRSEQAAWESAPAERPFVLLAQPSLFDSSRAPSGKHAAWAYCHVPHGSKVDMVDRIEAQVERFAPGFKRHILARSLMSPADLEKHNGNLVGGDISGGAVNLGQLFMRPTLRLYSTSVDRVFLCSASTPPGPGVHGLCGHFAGLLANKTCF